ncbi:MAG: hypothetical protein E7284_07450 [Lachnospiraceae bacterium]|nr:hypothetical protein [Lachnospiraceae bacterium]
MRTRGKEILINSLKIISASLIAISLAMLLHLEFAVSAGIVAILTIMPTKKETIKTAAGRLFAFAVALVIAFACYTLIGFHIWAFVVFLVIYIIVCQIFGWYNALTVCAMIMSHFLTFGDMGMKHILNEVLIFVLGVGMGVLANLHLRKDVNYIEQLKDETDAQIKKILARMSERILDKDLSDYNGECLHELRKSIRHAKNVADRNYNNQFRTTDVYDIEYIRMRDKQCMVLHEMYKIVRHIETTPNTAHLISDFLKYMAETYHKDNDGKVTLEKFREMDKEMKSRPLPVERKEFEDRAMLFGLMRKIEEFVLLKIEFSEKFPTS